MQNIKAALVTGGSRGIGAAIVKRLAQDGAHVAFTYSASPDQAAEVVAAVAAAGGRALAIRSDAADAAQVRSAVAQAAEAFGRLDILVTNAGILGVEPVDTFPMDLFDRMLAVNVRSAFVAIQEAQRFMGEGGRIVTIGSMVAERAGHPGSSVYALTKAAIAGMVRGMAADLGARGITINNVQPGPTATDMTPGTGPMADMLRNLLPVKRLGQPEEIAGMVAYLVSPEAGYVMGASLTIDGGMRA